MARLIKCQGKKCKEADLKYPKEELVEIGSKRYCKKCAKEKQERDELSKYICQKMQVPFVPTSIQKQMNDFHEYYSYHDIQLALQYAWDIEKKYIKKNTIGLVPYIIEEALKYFKKQKQITQQIQQKKNIGDNKLMYYKVKDRRKNIKKTLEYNFDIDYNVFIERNNF